MPKILLPHGAPRMAKAPKTPKQKKVLDYAQDGDFVKALEMMLTPRRRSLGTRFGQAQLTLLHLAVQKNDMDAAKMLIESGTPVDVKGGIFSNTFTPFIHALKMSSDETILALLELGATPSAETTCGQNALNYALDLKRSAAVVEAIMARLEIVKA